MKQALFAVILFCAPAVARAQELWAPSTPHVADPEAEPPPEVAPAVPAPCEVCSPVCPPGQTHAGVYLRLQIGGGYMSAQRNGATFTGDALAVGGAIGATVVPNLALFGTFLFHEVQNPTANMYGSSMTYSGAVASESFGLGLAYYLEPTNFYFSAAVLATSVAVTDFANNKYGTSNRGPGFDVTLGKEWWIGREWGLGLAAEITGAWMGDTDNHFLAWRWHTYSLLFSATYN